MKFKIMAFIVAGLPTLAGITVGAMQNKWSNYSIACVVCGVIGSIAFMCMFSYEEVEVFLRGIFKRYF